MSSLVSEVDRAVARKRIEQLVRQVEHAKKPNPASDEEIRNTVAAWEDKIFNKNKAAPQKYQDKIEAKAQDCQKELREAGAAKPQPAPAVAAAPVQAPPAPAPAPAPVRSAAAAAAAPVSAPQPKNARAPTAAAQQRAQEAVQQHVPAPRVSAQSNVAAAPAARPAQSTATASARPPAQAQASAPPAAARATQPSERTSPTVVPNVGPTSSSSVPPTGTDAGGAAAASGSKEYRKIEELREPLEQCRSMLRVLNVFGMGKKDQQLKEDFMRIFQQTTEVIKKHKQGKTSLPETEEDVVKIGRHLASLREKLDPRFAVIESHLHVSTVNEVFELDAVPFGLLERLMQFEPHIKHNDRCKRASWMIGGRQVLKRAREQSS